VGWLEDWGMVGSQPEKDLSDPQWVEGSGWRRSYTNSEGKTVQRALNPGERATLPGASLQEEQTRIAEDREASREGRLLQHQTTLQEKSDQRFNTQLQQQNAQFQASNALAIQQLQSSNATALAQLQNQGDQLKNQYQLGLAQLGESTAARKDATDARTAELSLTRQQMELNNNLQQQKLLQDDRQFERQAALDEKNNRRTKVLGALTLIAQSAAKF